MLSLAEASSIHLLPSKDTPSIASILASLDGEEFEIAPLRAIN
jgi:hypothetical protein